MTGLSRGAPFLIVAVLLSLTGCGTPRQPQRIAAQVSRSAGQRGTAGAARAKAAVARAVARQILESRDTVSGPPTAAAIALVAKQVRATCASQGGDRWGCTYRVGDLGPSACSMRLRGGTAVGLECGSGVRPPVSVARFTDCAKIGSVRTITDPAGDTYGPTSDRRTGRPVRAAAPEADLVAVRVVATAQQLCADFVLAHPPSSRTQLTFLARASHPSRSTTEALSATVDLSARDRRVKTLSRGYISAAVGTRRDHVSLVIEARDLVPPLAALLRDGFAFRAHAAYPRPGGHGAVSDDLPNQATWPIYR